MFVFINEKLDLYMSEKHENAFEEYEKDNSKKKAIYKFNDGRLEIVNSPLNFFEKEDILLKEKFEKRIIECNS